MNKLFHYGLVVFIVYGLFIGREKEMMEAILKTPFEVFDLVKTLVLSICFWNGILKLMTKSKMLDHLTIITKPLLRLIYGNDNLDKITYQTLCSNLIANLLGLGTLATMSGLQAMKHLKEIKQYKIMYILVIINVVGFSILPTTLMMLRSNYLSKDVLVFYPFSLFIGFILSVIGIVLVKVIYHE